MRRARQRRRPKPGPRIVNGLRGVLYLATAGERGARPFLTTGSPRDPDQRTDEQRALDWIEQTIRWWESGPPHEEAQL